MEDLIGQEIGGCRVDKKLGQGGMGAVYKGTQISLGREVAIKVIAEAYMANEQAVARFEREARTVAQLNHSNIVQVYDMGRSESGQYYIVMEFVDGKSIADILKTKGAIPERECLTMIRQAAKGLQAAAEMQIIHRDIKPDNLMLTKKGVVKVADFGLAKDTGSASQLTATGHVMGTPAYIAPEQGDGRVADHRSDIYSLGATLFAMLTGQMPYTGETPIAIVLQHIQAAIPDPREKNPEVSEGASKVVMKMMGKAPEERYQTAQELAHDIDVVLGVAKDGERLIADGGAMAFDEAMTLMGGDVGDGIISSGKAETLMEVASPTPHTIDAGALRAGGRKSRMPLFLGVGGGVVAVIVAVVLAVVLLGKKEPEPKPVPEPTPDTKTETPGPETKGEPGEKKGPGDTDVEKPTPPAPKIDVTITMPPTGSYHMTNKVTVKGRCGVEAKKVSINGADAVLSPTGDFRKVVELTEGANDIKVQVSGDGEASGEAIVTVIVDTTRPAVSFKGIQAGETVRTRTSPLRLEGTLDEMNPRRLSVAGESVPLDGENFSVQVELEEGDNRILVSAEDKAGNQSATRVRVTYDPTPPRITLSEVPASVSSAESRLELSGRVNEKIQSLQLDGNPVEFTGDAFSVAVDLKDGSNEFTFTARDLAGNESSETATVDYKRLIAGFSSSEEEGVYVWEKDGAKMVKVPVKGLVIGADEGAPDEKPAHEVALSPFFMDRTEVSNAQYARFLKALEEGGDPRAFSHPDEPEGKSHKPEFWDDPDLNKPDQPVVGVDWFDAWAFANWAGKSLPTEAQWEAAAFASILDHKPIYPWGDDEPEGRANFNDEIGITTAVGSYKDGANRIGLLDMAGNVQEWCLDWYAPDFYGKEEAAAADPVNEAPGSYRVLRGGHFMSPAGKIKITTRSYYYPTGRYETVGFRCVLVVK